MRFPWQKQEDELQRELAHHLAELTDEFQRRGHSPEEASLLARREFGGVELVKDQCRDESVWAWWGSVGKDLQYGVRQLLRTPVVTLAAVLSLALGVGANGAIFALMNTVLWRDLPVPRAEQIRLVHWTGKEFPDRYADNGSGSMYRDGASMVADFFSYAAFEAMQRGAKGRATLATYTFPEMASLAYEGKALVGQNRPVGGDFFHCLGVLPHLGRLLQKADDQAAAPNAVVLSHRFWQKQLQADQAVVGRQLRINNQNFTIVGVLPAEFYGLVPGDSTEIYTALWKTSSMALPDGNSPQLSDRRAWGTQLLARLAEGETSARLEPILQTAFQQSWEDKKNPKPEEMAWRPLVRLDDGRRGLGDLTRNFREPLWVLGGLLGLVLLIACANIANLLLARASARTKELALRLSLGCTRGRLLRQFLTEAALLSALGGLGSVGVAYGSSQLLSEMMRGRSNPNPMPMSMDLPLLAVLAGISGMTLLLFGLWPAWRATGIDTNAGLKEGSGSLGSATGRWWAPSRMLVMGQMALSLVLVCAAVLFTENLRRIARQDVGFERSNLLLFDVRPGTSGYGEEQLPGFYERLEQRLASVPGVVGVGIVNFRPMNQGGWWEDFRDPSGGRMLSAAMNAMSGTYLQALGIPLKEGRQFTRNDAQAGAPPVAIITEDLAQKLTAKLGAGNSAVGLYLERPQPKAPPIQVVGVAPKLALSSLKDRPFGVWIPFTGKEKQVTVLLRTQSKPLSVIPSVEAAVADLDRNLPLVDVFTMEQQIDRILQRERMFEKLCTAFGVLALVLSTVGLYGVMSYNTVRRRREIGVRVALGAKRGEVVWLVLREGLQLTVMGALLAAPLLLLGAKVVEKELTGFRALDPVLIAISLLLLLTAALGAAWWPAHRASRVDPMAALRQD